MMNTSQTNRDMTKSIRHRRRTTRNKTRQSRTLTMEPLTARELLAADFGDAPDTYLTLESSNGASHVVMQDYHLGNAIDAESDGQPSPNADGDDIHDINDDDGVTFLSNIVAGDTAQIEVVASAFGILDAWVDFDRDGHWTEPTERIFSVQPLKAGHNVLSFPVPSFSVAGDSFARFRFSPNGVPDSFGPGAEGEVEDYLIHILDQGSEPDRDYGDAPDSYRTLRISSGASHTVENDYFLGSSVDVEPDGLPTAAADGDNLDDDDDEDGVTFLNPMTPGLVTTLEVVASQDGVLDAWIDFNGDGDWADAGERIYNHLPLHHDLNTISFSAPISATEGATYARFRFSPDGVADFFGADGDGEVEDYQVEIKAPPNLAEISGTAFDDFNSNRFREIGEPGLSGWGIQLRDENGEVVATTMTAVDDPQTEIDESGFYRFSELEPGTYFVAEVLPEDYAQSGPVPHLVDPDAPQPLEEPAVIDANIGEVELRYLTVDDPANHLADTRDGLAGVTKLWLRRTDGRFLCSGSLLDSGRHVLTAAHCVTNDSGTMNTLQATATFELPGGDVVVDADISGTIVHPGWTGNVIAGNDIAILELDELAPIFAERFSVYHDTDEIGRVGTKSGYGRTGVGTSGATIRDGQKRFGQNRYDAGAEMLNRYFRGITPRTQLAYDFDNGLAVNDAFGSVYGINGLGLGNSEVNSAAGDSGGPTFIDSKVAGITSWGFGLGGVPDINPGTDSSYGEFSIDTRVSTYADWVDSMINVGRSPTELVSIDWSGTLYDINLRTGAATRARYTGIDGAIGISAGPDGNLFAVTSSSSTVANPNWLYKIDPASGHTRSMGSTGLSGIHEGDLDFDPVSGLLYLTYSRDDINTNDRRLFTIDTNSESTLATEVATIEDFPYDVSGMSFDPDGNLFLFVPGDFHHLAQVDRLTGHIISQTTTVGGEATLGPVSGMDFDPATGSLMVVDGGSSTQGFLQRLAPGSGALASVGPTGLDTTLAKALSGLEFVPSLTRVGRVGHAMHLDFGDIVTTADFANHLASDSVGGFIFEDFDLNGEQGNGENGLANWELQLVDVDGQLVATTTTREDDPQTPNLIEAGEYLFTDVPLGSYDLIPIFPDGWFEPTSNRIIGIDFDGMLYDIDPSSGTASRPRDTGLDQPIGITRGPAGDFYTITTSDGDSLRGVRSALYRIDVSTGEATFIGETDIDGLQEGDLDFDPTDGTLYMMGTDDRLEPLAIGQARMLYTVDITTGAATHVGLMRRPDAPESSDVSGIAFDSDGNLFALETGSAIDAIMPVNKSTGTVAFGTPRQIVEGGSLQDLGTIAGIDYDPASGEMILVDGDGSSTSFLRKLSPSTGNAERIGPTGLPDGLAGVEMYVRSSYRIPFELVAGDSLQPIVIGAFPQQAVELPTVISIDVNATQADPQDLPETPQPTSWEQQRSELGSIRVVFSEPVNVNTNDLRLINLGVDASNDQDKLVPIDVDQLTVEDNVLIIEFPPGELDDGVYQFEVLPTTTDAYGNELDGDGDGIAGDRYVYTGSSSNAFYQLTADFNRDGGVSIFDFGVFAYWFGASVPIAPTYVDMNHDGGVSIFDFSKFAENFGVGINFPTAAVANAGVDTGLGERKGGENQPQARRASTTPIRICDPSILFDQQEIERKTRRDAQQRVEDEALASVCNDIHDLESVLDDIVADGWLNRV